MKYTGEGDQVTLEMTAEDFEYLLLLLGHASGAISKENNPARFWHAIGWVNRLNATNKNFTPYEVPKQFTKRKA